MDLHLVPGAVATPDERAAVDAAIGSLPPWSAERRSLLLPALHALQRASGQISPGGLNHVCAQLDVAPAEAYAVASFYHLFTFEPQPSAVIHACDDIACRINGGRELCEKIEAALGPEGHPAPGSRTGWRRSPCLGLCDRAPAVLVQRSRTAASDDSLAPATLGAALALGAVPGKPAEPTVPALAGPLLRRIGAVDPTSIDAYIATDGFEALRRALEVGGDAVIAEVTAARLMGRGGAAFPTGRKWADVARAPARPHYLVCNADESEPGTFKDRVLMEGDPFAIVEAMTIAGVATGCARGYLYVRGEYPLAAERLRNAIDRARERGFLGENVLGGGAAFDIEVRQGAGAYICGEETALFNSIEGFRGEPRNKPPFPTQAGLFGKPTLVNNVETLANVPAIVLQGGAAFANTGTEASTGTRLFCLSGRVERPGVYEVPFGTTVRALIAMAGGVREGRPLQAVLLGGAAGSFLRPDEIDLPLSLEDARRAGASLGSGVVMVFDDAVDLGDTVLRIASFFRDESCGQCVPCRVGTQRVEECLHRLAAGKPLGSVAQELILFEEMSAAMQDASICGLGHTASNAARSALAKFNLYGAAPL